MTNTNSKSAQMIALYNEGNDIKTVATTMNVRYQFAYNVISNYCRMNDVELRTKSKDDSKKVAIIALLEEGKTVTEISTELKTSTNHVYQVRKKFEAAKAAAEKEKKGA